MPALTPQEQRKSLAASYAKTIGTYGDEAIANLLETEVLAGFPEDSPQYQLVLQAAWRLRRANGGNTNNGR